jgi:predicted transcriptional regulator
MDQTQKQALQVTKEIVVKFIETNRISPNNFPELFEGIYLAVLRTIRGDSASEPLEKDNGPELAD